jgi:hypothetical protein
VCDRVGERDEFVVPSDETFHVRFTTRSSHPGNAERRYTSYAAG